MTQNLPIKPQPAVFGSRLVMQALLESEAQGQSRALLADHLGVELEVLDSMVAAYESANGPGSWGMQVSESKIRTNVTSANWDDLELEVTTRLLESVQQGKVTRVSDLLAVARTANAAARRSSWSEDARRQAMGQQGHGNSGFGASAMFSMPGGQHGVIEMRLSATIADSLQTQHQRAQGPGYGPHGEIANQRHIDDPIELRALAADEVESDSDEESRE